LEARLLERSRNRGLSLVRLRRTVVFDRLLARLLVVAPDRWVLKGGLALEYRLGSRARTTRDMDLGREDDEVAATTDMVAARLLDLGDLFFFRIERTDALDALLEGVAVRYRVRAELAGRPFETVILDVGFEPTLDVQPDRVRTSDLLEFAGLEPSTVPALPLPQHVAEKVHAYTRSYGPDGSSSTRAKDLVDLVLLCTTEAFQAGMLRRALEKTFRQRSAHALPTGFPPPPAYWVAPYAKLAAEIGLDQDLASAHAMAAGFLDSVLMGTLPDGAQWEPTGGVWTYPD
jgi:predicted nucleotidyltransferase component of viral defense system